MTPRIYEVHCRRGTDLKPYMIVVVFAEPLATHVVQPEEVIAFEIARKAAISVDLTGQAYAVYPIAGSFPLVNGYLVIATEEMIDEAVGGAEDDDRAVRAESEPEI